MLRRLLTVLLILTSLSAQASTVFACDLMEQVVMHHCCCGGEQMPAGDDGAGKPCCQQIVVISDDSVAGDLNVSAAKQFQFDREHLPLLATMAVVLLPELRQPVPAPAQPPVAVAGSGTLTYLHTLRLRI